MTKTIPSPFLGEPLRLLPPGMVTGSILAIRAVPTPPSYSFEIFICVPGVKYVGNQLLSQSVGGPVPSDPNDPYDYTNWRQTGQLSWIVAVRGTEVTIDKPDNTTSFDFEQHAIVKVVRNETNKWTTLHTAHPESLQQLRDHKELDFL